MTMNSFRPNKGRRRLWAATILALAVFAADVVSGGAVRAQVRTVAAALSSRTAAIARRVSDSGFFSSRASLAAQNRSLSEQLAQYEERAAAYAVLEAENAQLRDMARLASRGPGMTVPVVSSIGSSPYGTFLIGAGQTEGVGEGNIVLTAEGFVLGSVRDVALHTATVAETLGPRTSTDAIISGTAVVVDGRGGGNGRTSVPRGVDIAVGSSVAAPAYAGRPIGVVGSTATSSGGATQNVFIHLPVNRSGLQFVYVASSR